MELFNLERPQLKRNVLLVFQYVKAAPKEAGVQLFSILIVPWLNLPQGRTGLESWEKNVSI